MELRSSPLQKYTWRSAAVEKLEVLEQCSGVLRLALTIDWDCGTVRLCTRGLHGPSGKGPGRTRKLNLNEQDQAQRPTCRAGPGCKLNYTRNQGCPQDVKSQDRDGQPPRPRRDRDVPFLPRCIVCIAVFPMSVCPSVRLSFRLSVCLSNA